MIACIDHKVAFLTMLPSHTFFLCLTAMSPQQSLTMRTGESQWAGGQPGYKHVRRLAKALVEVRNLLGLSKSRVDRLVELWQALPEPDQQRVVYPPQHKERLVRGRF
ncbi:hypothetical protein DPEC_G00373960 [Dallia pectoralis]|nr:hypothetical protein DPEC_G00373960 [Dallia pectoralis]